MVGDTAACVRGREALLAWGGSSGCCCYCSVMASFLRVDPGAPLAPQPHMYILGDGLSVLWQKFWARRGTPCWLLHSPLSPTIHCCVWHCTSQLLWLGRASVLLAVPLQRLLGWGRKVITILLAPLAPWLPNTLIGAALCCPAHMAGQGQHRASPAVAKIPTRRDPGTSSYLAPRASAPLTPPWLGY